MFGTPEFAAWSHMIQRCTNPNDDSYADYGARGITVCDRWKNDFLNFFADMGPRPTGMTLERDEVNGNYEPGNCRWATKKEQANNTRRNRLIELDGERGTLQWWADKTGIGRGTIAWRLNRGWSVKEALTP
jgi:hypothetical protein